MSRKPSGYWNNYEHCYEEAKKYKSRGEFSNESSTAWSYAKKNGWIDDYIWFKEIVKPNGYWNYEHCYEEAKKYKTRTEFERLSPSASTVARKNSWIDDYTWIPKPNKKKRGYWDYDNCYNEAKKYKSRSEFQFGCSSAYKSAKRNKWLDDYTWLEDERFNVYTDKIDCVYVYEFVEQKSAYIGRTLLRRQKQRDLEHIFGDDSVSTFAKSLDIPIPEMKILETNLTIKEGSENEGIWIELYREDGWTILNKAKAGSLGRLGNRYPKYTHEVCYNEAKKYNSRHEFIRGNRSAYNAALKNNWLDEFFPKTKIEYTYYICKKLAEDCKTRSEYSKKHSTAYIKSSKNKWLDEFFPKTK